MNGEHFSLYSKHKHMMKNGAPPDQFGGLYHLLSIQLHGLIAESTFQGQTPWFLV